MCDLQLYAKCFLDFCKEFKYAADPARGSCFMALVLKHHVPIFHKFSLVAGNYEQTIISKG